MIINVGGQRSEDKLRATIDEMIKAADTSYMGPYIAFCTNANTDALDAAFGKNNEENVRDIGKALAMYGWFKGNDKTAYPFTNLKTKNTLNEIMSNTTAKEELLSSIPVRDIVHTSPYALEKLNGTTEVLYDNGVFKNGWKNIKNDIQTLLSTVYGTGKVTIGTNSIDLSIGTAHTSTAKVAYAYAQLIIPKMYYTGTLTIELTLKSFNYVNTNFYFAFGALHSNTVKNNGYQLMSPSKSLNINQNTELTKYTLSIELSNPSYPFGQNNLLMSICNSTTFSTNTYIQSTMSMSINKVYVTR